MMKHYKNFSQIVTLKAAGKKDGRKLFPEDLSIINNGSIVVDDSQILWVGKSSSLPKQYKDTSSVDCKNKVVIPPVVDCHTHLVFGGDRSHEYSMRLSGADYEEIAKAGGGILNTMNGTNSATPKELYNSAATRIDRLKSYGVKVIEIKSGYGLNFEREYLISHIINDLKLHFKDELIIKNTFMAAHAVPKEFPTPKDYLSRVVFPLLEKLASENIIDAVDIFHESGYFSSQDTTDLFTKANSLKIPVKSHADEFYDNKGAILATKFNALSTDHLLRTAEDGIKALANSTTVATLLPGTGFFLGKEQAPARKFLDSGVKVAIGSDFNPGSCHCDNVILIASLAAPKYKMNLCELWAAITLNSAHALGINNIGTIETGKLPLFTIFNTDSIDKITYSWGQNLYL